MNTRRKFLIQGGLATTAMLALKPFSAIARATSPFTGTGHIYGRLVFLHTANFDPRSEQQLTRHIADIKNNRPHAILLKAGQGANEKTSSQSFDVAINDTSATNGDYKIIKKGSVRTGIISAQPGDHDVIQKVNRLSAYLKKEKNCAVVVCLSLLGYKNANAPDDVKLASRSTHLDVIIGGNTENFPKYPMIALNSNNEEVLIHSAAGNPAGLGEIAIGFDERDQKRHISFADKPSKQASAVA